MLERVAYLNAGTFGPLARPTVEAIAAELRADAERRGARPRVLRARARRCGSEVRARLAALVGVEPAHVALTRSTTDGCNIVLAGLDLGPEDEVVTTDDEHFGPARAAARVAVRASSWPRPSRTRSSPR